MRKGQKMSAESRAKMSASKMGRKLSDEHRANISAAKTGQAMSLETRAKISASKIGKAMPDEQRALLSAINKGKNLTPEHKARIGAAHKGQAHTPQWTENIKKGLERRYGTREEQLMAYTRKTRGCWWWDGPTDQNGYSLLAGKLRGHRISYSLFVGELIPGYHIHHTCRNKLCVKPAHLVQVTPEEHREVHSHGERHERYLNASHQ
jgi:hypothetical protein